MGARIYNPSLGTFISSDSVIGSPQDPRTFNRYLYGRGAPLDFTDPDGHFSNPLDDIIRVVTDVINDVVNFVQTVVGDAVSNVSSAIHQGQSEMHSAISVLASLAAPLLQSVPFGPDLLDFGQTVATGFVDSIANWGDRLIHGDPHAILDVLGFIPVVGEAFDVINGLLYLSEGDLPNALVSFASLIPVVGIAIVAGGRIGVKAVLNVIEDTAAATSVIRRPAVASGIKPISEGLTSTASTVARACSFSGATVVLMADGSEKPIDQVDVGDEVIASDPETGERSARPVEQTFVHEDTVIDVVVDGETITTTEDHPFWSVTDHRFERADELERGELVLTASGERARVDGTQAGTERTTLTYNLAIEGIHTYHVGATQVLVHNTCPISQPLWSAGKPGDPVVNAFDHYTKHGSDFPNVDNALQYVSEAQSFLRSPPPGTLSFSRLNGDTVRYNSTLNWFGVISGSGAPRTFFAPPNGIGLFMEQLARAL